MPTMVLCPHCQAQFEAQDWLYGQTVPCPNCRTAFTIPHPAPMPAANPLQQLPTLPAPMEPATSPMDFAPATSTAPSALGRPSRPRSRRRRSRVEVFPIVVAGVGFLHAAVILWALTRAWPSFQLVLRMGVGTHPLVLISLLIVAVQAIAAIGFVVGGVGLLARKPFGLEVGYAASCVQLFLTVAGILLAFASMALAGDGASARVVGEIAVRFVFAIAPVLYLTLHSRRN